GVLEEIRAFLARKPTVDLLQMAFSVVARNARDIDAEESLGVKDRQLVIGIELLHHAEIVAVVWLRFALYVLTRDDVGSRDDVIALPGRGDDRSGNIVVWTIDGEIFLHPVMEKVLPAAHLAISAEEIHEEVSPLVDIGVAGEQFVNKLRTL